MNERQYFEIEMEMETDSQRVVEVWTLEAASIKGDRVCNIGLPVWCYNPLWMGSTRGTATTAFLVVILPDRNNKPNILVGIHSLSPSFIRFVRSTLMLTAKDTRRVVELWMWDASPPDGNIWFQRRRQLWKGILKSLIHWGGDDRSMWDQTKDYWFLGQGLTLFQIGLWAVHGKFRQEG